MPLKWFNIKSGETLVAETAEHIAALWASSDRSPNITQGEDRGWRLAPAVKVEMEKIMGDRSELEHLASIFRKSVEDLGESDILAYISNKTELEAAPVAKVSDYQDEYDAQVRKLEGKDSPTELTPADASTLSTAELEAMLEARYAEEASTTTTTTGSTTTTTTVVE